MKIAVASCLQLPEVDPDEQLLLEGLRKRGAEVDVLAWDDASAPFVDYDVVVIRSTWNYFERLDAFLEWAARTATKTRLLNPVEVLRTNVHKSYLPALEARGGATVPTHFVSKGEPVDVSTIADARGWGAVVVKPTVSAGSFRTKRFDPAARADATAFARALAADRDVMIQPWMPAVEAYGERSLVWIAGRFTHAIRKAPRWDDGAESVSRDVVPIQEGEIDLAERAIAPFSGGILYGRVDVIQDEDGNSRVMELELVEPSLFLLQCPEALERFCDALCDLTPTR